MVDHTCNPSIQEAEVGGVGGVNGHEFEANLGYNVRLGCV